MIGSLTLDQLRVLVAIDDTGSFSAAGRKLRRVQSAISHMVQGLEAVQGVQLFDRSGRTPRLTEAGRVLTAQARQVLRQADTFELTARTIAAGLEPELSIAVDSFVPTPPVIAVLAGLQRRHPHLAVTLFTEGIGAAERRVRDGSATLGICGLIPGQGQDLHAHPLARVPLMHVVAATHPLARETRPITREVLAEHVQLILTAPQLDTGPTLGVISPRVWRFVDIARRLEFMLAGFGWGGMPVHLVRPHLESGALVPLRLEEPVALPGGIELFAIHDRTQLLGPGARWLLEELGRQPWDDDDGMSGRSAET